MSVRRAMPQPVAHAVKPALVRMLALTLTLGSGASLTASAACPAWPAWDSFAKTFITDTGRLIDPATPNGQTTSEGQAYALFLHSWQATVNGLPACCAGARTISPLVT